MSDERRGRTVISMLRGIEVAGSTTMLFESFLIDAHGRSIRRHQSTRFSVSRFPTSGKRGNIEAEAISEWECCMESGGCNISGEVAFVLWKGTLKAVVRELIVHFQCVI